VVGHVSREARIRGPRRVTERIRRDDREMDHDYCDCNNSEQCCERVSACSSDASLKQRQTGATGYADLKRGVN
jgi:hypothetical protein